MSAFVIPDDSIPLTSLGSVVPLTHLKQWAVTLYLQPMGISTGYSRDSDRRGMT